MSGTQDQAEHADPQAAWVQRVLRPMARRIEERVAANGAIAEMLAAPSERHGPNALWAEPTDGDITEQRRRSVDLILAAQFDEGFEQREAQKRKDTAAALAKDATVQKAHAEWPDWCEDQKKHGPEIEAFITTVLAKQGKIIGLGDKPPAIQLGKPGDNAASLGLFNVKSGNIEIAKLHPDFGMFLNTLTHENTHAFQAKLVDGLRSEQLDPSDPDYLAALALSMNREQGYISPELSEQFNPADPEAAYKKQCSEAHAFKAGDEVSEAVVEQLDARLSPEQRQQRGERMQAAKAAFDKLQDEKAAQERQDLAQAEAADDAHLAKVKKDSQDITAFLAEHERAKQESETQRPGNPGAEWDEMEQGAEATDKLYTQMALNNPESQRGAITEYAGLSDAEFDDFIVLARQDPDLTPKNYKIFLERRNAKLQEKMAKMLDEVERKRKLLEIKDKFDLDDEEFGLFIEMQEELPEETPENIIAGIRG